MTDKEKMDALKKPFDIENIRFKIQVQPRDNAPQGEALIVAYMDARDVMERLDEVFPFGWSDSYSASPVGGIECQLTVNGVTRSDVGVASKTEKEKAAYSDAFKRAAVKFGIGRFLYELPKLKAQAKKFGKSYYIVFGEEDKLRRVIAGHLSGKAPKKKKAPTPAPKQAETTPRKVAQNLGGVARDNAPLSEGNGTINPKWVVANKLAKDIPAAAQVINSLGLAGKSITEGKPRLELYREWRNTLDPKEAALKAVAGEKPNYNG